MAAKNAAFRQSRMGFGFIDSLSLRVCDNLRIPRHKTFKGEAECGKSSTGWFYGFKLHLLVDDCGNVDDRTPVPEMLKNFSGKVFCDSRLYFQKIDRITGKR